MRGATRLVGTARATGSAGRRANPRQQPRPLAHATDAVARQALGALQVKGEAPVESRRAELYKRLYKPARTSIQNPAE